MIPGCILAGGNARRLGGQGKALIKLSNKNLLDLVIEKLEDQVSILAINTRNKNIKLNDNYTHIEDTIKENGGAGPLAGILSAIIWAKHIRPQEKYVLTVPVDCPFIPSDLVNNLYSSVLDNNFDIVVASSNHNVHPVIAIWSYKLISPLEVAMKKGIRKIDLFTSACNVKTINWNVNNIDPFFNINSPEDLLLANSYINS